MVSRKRLERAIQLETRADQQEAQKTRREKRKKWEALKGNLIAASAVGAARLVQMTLADPFSVY